jgi:putative acetyltransferase
MMGFFDFLKGETMGLIIRPPKPSDAEDMHAIRISDSRVYMLGLTTNTLMSTRKMLENLSANDHILVAEVDGKVIGTAGLHIYPSPRLSHSATFGIGLLPGYQGKGIGTQLMKELLDLADNWLMLVRIELDVFEDNLHAIHLYEKMGFVLEGKKRYATKRYGNYETECFMARYNHKLTGGLHNGESNGK